MKGMIYWSQTMILLNKRKRVGVLLLLLCIGVVAGIYGLRTTWGMEGRYYANAKWKGTPHFVRRDRATSLQGTDVFDRLGTRAFSVKWQGWIVIPETGKYTFATQSDDGSYLTIDDTLVVDNGGVHGKRKASGEISLEKGMYRFDVLYFTVGGHGMINLFWTRPDKAEERLPAEHLFVKRPAWINFVLRSAFMAFLEHLNVSARLLGIGLILLVPFLFLLKIFMPYFRIFFQSSSKKIIFSGCILILLIGSVEVFAALFFTVFREQFTFFDARRYLLTPEEQDQRIEKIEMSGDMYLTLGWDNHFSTPSGERPRETLYDIPLMATFGDSFTYCDEVEHNQSWQTYLSDLFQMDVYNFGVNGYGTDQAYLKFLAVFPDIQTPIAMLGVTTENINRIVNVYRPFYFPRTSGRSTKPRFLLKNNELAILNNPIQTKDDVHKLGDPRFIHEIGQFDWWYNRDNYPVLHFPYSKILFNKRMWLEAMYGKADRQIDDMNPRPWEDLWDSEDARALMFRLLDAFVEHAQEHHAIPIIAILPLQYQVRLRFQTQEHESRVRQLMEYCHKNGYAHVETITALANSVTAEEEIRDLYVGHVSPKGNRIIADALFQYLQQQFPEIITSRKQTIRNVH